MPTLKIDGNEVTVEKGTTVLQAARKIGIDVPVFCYHEKLEPMGACRLCMVEMVGPRGPMLTIACATPAADNMVINTQAPAAVKERNGVLEFILANHPLDCPVCDRGGECDLQDNTFRFGPGTSRFLEVKREWDDYDMGPYIARCQNRCVRCYRCVRYYEEIVGKPELGAYTRGCTMEIRTFDDKHLDFGMSGNLSEVCPVGALLDKTYLHKGRPWEIRDTSTVCSHCSYGCNMRLGIRQGEILRVKPLQNEDVNEVWLCDRGRFAHTFKKPHRISSPMVRKGNELVEVSWDEAYAFVANALQEILKTDGPDAVGGITSGRPANEDIYAFQKFLRAAVGTNNIAHRTYPMGESFLAATGAEAATNSIVGLEKSKAFFVIGSDLVVQQPVLATRIRRAVRKGATFIAADSRKLRYNMVNITSRLRYSAGTAPTLLLGLVNVILEENLFDAEQVNARIPDLDGLRKAVAEFGPSTVADQSGVDADTLRSTARALAGAGGVTFLYGEEVLESPGCARATSALVTLAILTGGLGREDAGLMPLIQECNAQGANDLGARPDRLPGYASVTDRSARERLSSLWDTSLPDTVGMGLIEMITAAANGQLKALLVMGNDLVGKERTTNVAESLEKLKLLVVQDLYLTETARRAHVVLPARSALERPGTFTNIDRRVQSIREALPIAGGARPDWQILAGIARKMGKDLRLNSPAAILQEAAQAAPIYSGINYDTLGRHGRRWALPLA